MENVNSEDYVGVSPREVSFNQRLQGGLIPTYERLHLFLSIWADTRGLPITPSLAIRPS